MPSGPGKAREESPVPLHWTDFKHDGQAAALAQAIGELVAEKSGVLNLGVEGMMIMGAVCAFAATQMTGSPYIGIVAGIVGGGLFSLLFTALNNQYWTTDVLAPMANVPVVIFQYAMSPYENWHTLAWAGAFILTMFVLLISLVARAIVMRNKISNN